MLEYCFAEHRICIGFGNVRLFQSAGWRVGVQVFDGVQV
jgi:hypothetical protein